MDVGRVMPQSPDSENYLIGAILLTGVNALEQVTGILSDEMFYFPRNALLYRSFVEMQEAMQPVDMISVVEWLRRTGRLEDCGGADMIAELTMPVCSDAHVAVHAGIVRDKYLRRRLIEASQKAYGHSFDETEDIGDTVAICDTEIRRVEELMTGHNDASFVNEAGRQSITDAYRRASQKRQGADVAVTTGFDGLNRKLSGGWKSPDLVILAARPSVGKTALAIHFAQRAARCGTPVLFVSLEMGKKQLADRMIIGASGVDAWEYSSGNISDENLAKAEQTFFRELAPLPICLSDSPVQTVTAIMAEARVLRRQGKCGMLIVDYLQLITPVFRTGQNREQEISQISRSLKLGAKALDIPVIVLSQQNRQGATGAGASDLATLRDSGAIEQDADAVIFVERDFDATDADGNTVNSVVRLNVRKNRHGETGAVYVTHNASMTAFYDCQYSHPAAARVKGKTAAARAAGPDRFHESKRNEDENEILPF
jgi:replicative DNA helicase